MIDDEMAEEIADMQKDAVECIVTAMEVILSREEELFGQGFVSHKDRRELALDIMRLIKQPT